MIEHTRAYRHLLATMQCNGRSREAKNKKKEAKAKTQRHAISHTQKPVTECKMRLHVKATMCAQYTHLSLNVFMHLHNQSGKWQKERDWRRSRYGVTPAHTYAPKGQTIYTNRHSSAAHSCSASRCLEKAQKVVRKKHKKQRLPPNACKKV